MPLLRPAARHHHTPEAGCGAIVPRVPVVRAAVIVPVVVVVVVVPRPPPPSPVVIARQLVLDRVFRLPARAVSGDDALERLGARPRPTRRLGGRPRPSRRRVGEMVPEAGGPEVIRGGGGARPEVLGVMPLLVGQHRHRAFCAVPARANRADILNIICGVRRKQTGETEAVGENDAVSFNHFGWACLHFLHEKANATNTSPHCHDD